MANRLNFRFARTRYFDLWHGVELHPADIPNDLRSVPEDSRKGNRIQQMPD